MSNKTQLQTNNTELSSLIETLRGKASGGGSGAVETSMVTISGDADSSMLISYTTVDENDEMIGNCIAFLRNPISIKVVKNTAFFLAEALLGSNETAGIELITSGSRGYGYQLLSSAGDTETVTVVAD